MISSTVGSRGSLGLISALTASTIYTLHLRGAILKVPSSGRPHVLASNIATTYYSVAHFPPLENSRNGDFPMIPAECLPGRRNFLKAGVVLATGLSGVALLPQPAVSEESDAWVIGPKPGFTPEIGTLTSMLAFTRMQVLNSVKGMSQADLDFLFDGKANTIGALLLHLAATDSYYHLNSFQGIAWGKFPDAAKQKWEVAMNLGEPARKTIKGNSLDYYLNVLNESREKTLGELKKRDDKWLAALDTEAGMNNYGKWFHVADHESNHNGQIKFLKSRLHGAKPASE